METVELDDGLEIIGKPVSELKRGVSVYCYDDHRVAMAFSVLGVVVADTIIEEKRCVEKTWPNWWDDLENKVNKSTLSIGISLLIFYFFNRSASRSKALMWLQRRNKHLPVEHTGLNLVHRLS